MDNTNKYLFIQHEGKNVYEIVDEMIVKYKYPLFAVKKLMEILPVLSLMEAKEIVTIRTSEHKSLEDYQKSLFDCLEELDKEMKMDENHGYNTYFYSPPL